MFLSATPPSPGGVTMLEAVTNALGTVLDWVGSVVTSLTTASGELNGLLPLLAIGIGVSALMLGVKAIKGFAWGA